MTGKRRSRAKKNHKTVTLDVKLDVLRRFDAGEKRSQIANSLGLTTDTVYGICNNKDNMERLLIMWIKDQTKQNLPINKTDIQEKARSLYNDLMIEEGGNTEEKHFKAGNDWFRRFKRRLHLYNIKITLDGEATSAETVVSRKCPDKQSTSCLQKESAGSSVEDQELGLVIDKDSMTPNSKVAKSDTNVTPRAVLKEAVVLPQSTKAATQEKTTVAVPNHQVALKRPCTACEQQKESTDSSVEDQESGSDTDTDYMAPNSKYQKIQPKLLPHDSNPSHDLDHCLQQAIHSYCSKQKEPTGSSVGNQESGSDTDTDSVAPNSKVAKSDANVTPHAVLQEVMVFPQSTKAATQKEKKTLTVPKYKVAFMSNLLSMWKAEQLCDAYISNGTTKIMVHKMVLGAACPKVLPLLNRSSRSAFPTMSFPNISKETLLAFAEFLYSGVLDLTKDVLVQLRCIAKRLDMKDLAELCSNQLNKAMVASMLSAVAEPQLAEPCSQCGLPSSSTPRSTDSGHSQNTILGPLLKLLENINSIKSSISQGVVPTDNLATVDGPSSSSSVPTLKSLPATITADEVIDIKTELESDDDTILTPNSQQPKMIPNSPVIDLSAIQEELLKDFDNIIQKLGLGYG